MNDFISFLETMPFWYWWVLAIILLVAEISTGSTYLLWPAAAATAVGFLDLWPLDGAWQWQLAIFAVLTVFLTVWATPKAKPWLQKSRADHHTLNERGAQKIGRSAKVEEAFSGGVGRVRYGDTVWLAESAAGEDFPAGAEVRIVRTEGSKLFVGPAEHHAG